MTAATRLRDTALFYASRGLPVFPLSQRRKYPLKGTRGFLEASCDPETVAEWWTGDTEYNIGIACGPAGLVVIDIDKKPGVDGQAHFEAWLAGRTLPATHTVQTRSGGQHLYFTGTGVNSAQNLPCPGVDIRAEGGYVVAPPSFVDADAKGPAGSYWFTDTSAIAGLPGWIQAALTAPKTREALPAIVEHDIVLLDDFPPTRVNGLKLLEAVRARKMRVDCSNEKEWFNLLLEFRSLVFLCGWPETSAWRLFDFVSRRIGGNYDLNENRRRWERNDFDPAGRTYKSLLAELKNIPEAAALPAKRFQPLTISELQNQPPAGWLIRHILPQSGLASIFGPPGSGKTFLALDMLMALSRGVDWFGFRVKAPVKIVYVALEGGSGIRQRLLAYLKHNALPAPDNFFTVLDNLDIRHDAPALLEEIQPLTPAIVVIDTLAQAAPGMDENANADMSQVLNAAKQIAATINGVCLLIHHSGKDAARGLRGHSSLLAALDSAIEIQAATATAPHCFRVAKSKDGPADISTAFNLAVINLGIDEDGEPLTSCVVERDLNAVFTRQPTGSNQITALKHLKPLLPLTSDEAVAAVAGQLQGDRAKRRAQEAVEALVNQGFFRETGGKLELV